MKQQVRLEPMPRRRCDRARPLPTPDSPLQHRPPPGLDRAERRRRPIWQVTKVLHIWQAWSLFPLSYVAYARDRGALDARQLLLQAPPRLHGPLSVAHAAMYGLMLFWGYRMFFPRPADAALARHQKPE